MRKGKSFWNYKWNGNYLTVSAVTGWLDILIFSRKNNEWEREPAHTQQTTSELKHIRERIHVITFWKHILKSQKRIKHVIQAGTQQQSHNNYYTTTKNKSIIKMITLA